MLDAAEETIWLCDELETNFCAFIHDKSAVIRSQGPGLKCPENVWHCIAPISFGNEVSTCPLST